MQGMKAMATNQPTTKNWFTSDLHLGHQNSSGKGIITHCDRPFKSIDEMDSSLISTWNALVGPQDNVFVLGDFSFHNPRRTSDILHSLRGHKVLVKGNHDSSKALSKTIGWARVVHYLELRLGDDKLVLSHFPFMSWNKMHYGAYHLHGHSHGTLRYPGELVTSRIYDVGVDSVAASFGVYRPLEWEEIKKHLKDRRFTSLDHHNVNHERGPFYG